MNGKLSGGMEPRSGQHAHIKSVLSGMCKRSSAYTFGARNFQFSFWMSSPDFQSFERIDFFVSDYIQNSSF